MPFFQKLKSIKHAEWILLLFAAGMLVLYFSSGGVQAQDTAEQRLSKVLSRIEGAGSVHVFISYDDIQESTYAFSLSAGANGSETGKIKGVVIVASGAGDTAVKLKLAEAARTALGVDASCVSVYKMDSK